MWWLVSLRQMEMEGDHIENHIQHVWASNSQSTKEQQYKSMKKKDCTMLFRSIQKFAPMQVVVPQVENDEEGRRQLRAFVDGVLELS